MLSLVKLYSDRYVPWVVRQDFPQVLTELRDEKALILPSDKLLLECKKVKLTISQQQADLIKSETRGQSSKLCFQFRAGRITT